ncbi:MAG: hypothetical protein HY766_04165 [candidate division NC10 bacterium]|nr:hypothetical protein [candidate division NC10 bacterium]
MGATLPVLCAHYVARAGGGGRTMGLFYAANSGGAVVGGLVTGFWLIARIGLSNSAFVAQVLNSLVGVLSLLVDRIVAVPARPPEDTAGGPDGPVAAPACPVTPEPSCPEAEAGFPEVGAGLVHLAVFVSGFTAMLFEIALMKLLPLIFGSSIYAFSLMVCSFIAGITLGSFASRSNSGRSRRSVSASASPSCSCRPSSWAPCSRWRRSS